MLVNTSCSCNCRPCVCASPAGEGCLPDLCVPRPCFFDGQLIGSEDLNALIRYSRTRDLAFGRFAAGWGIYGGLVVDAAPGIEHVPLGGAKQILPNPQILAGTTVMVSAGVAIDALGRQLVTCAPAIVDLAALASQAPTTPQTKSCLDWFGDELPGCDPQQPEMITATEYWLIAEYQETPTRPAPQYSGGGACDPAPTCDYSRKNESVRYSLVPRIPIESYFLTGCLDGELTANIGEPPEPVGDGDDFTRDMFGFVDNIDSILAAQCCQRPAVVLARVLFTSSPGSLAPTLQAPLFAIIDDAYPNRRIVPAHATTWILILSLLEQSARAQPVALARVQGTALSGRGFQTPVGFDSGTKTYTLTLTQSVPENERTSLVTPYVDSNPASPPLTPRVVDTSSTTLTLQFIDSAGAPQEPFAFGIAVHRAA